MSYHHTNHRNTNGRGNTRPRNIRSSRTNDEQSHMGGSTRGRNYRGRGGRGGHGFPKARVAYQSNFSNSRGWESNDRESGGNNYEARGNGRNNYESRGNGRNGYEARGNGRNGYDARGNGRNGYEARGNGRNGYEARGNGYDHSKRPTRGFQKTRTPDTSPKYVFGKEKERVVKNKGRTTTIVRSEARTQRAIVADVLGINASSSWSIVNRLDDLVLVHYNYTPKYKEIEHPELRGVIVDLEKRVVVCRSSKMDINICSDRIEDSKDDEEYIVYGGRKLPKGTLFTPGYDGVFIRIFLWKGKVYFSTLKKIHAITARLLRSRNFIELYKESGGPDLDAIFDSKYQYSPWVFSLVLCHRELVNVSRLELDGGVLVYVGAYSMYDKKNSPYPKEEVQWTRPNLVLATELKQGLASRTPFKSEMLTLKAANDFLKYGYGPKVEFEDIHRHHTDGECVIAILPPSDTDSPDSPPEVVRVHSFAYHKRYTMVDNQANLPLRFFQLATIAMQPFDSESALYHYLSKFPVVEDLENMNEVPKRLSKSTKKLTTFRERLRNIWLNFMLAVPVYRRKEVLPLFDFYFYAMREVRTWLFKNYHLQSNEKIHSRATRDAMYKLKQIANRRQNKRLSSYDVHNLVYWSTGWEIYSIYKSSLKSIDDEGIISVQKTPLEEENGYTLSNTSTPKDEVKEKEGKEKSEEEDEDEEEEDVEKEEEDEDEDEVEEDEVEEED